MKFKQLLFALGLFWYLGANAQGWNADLGIKNQGINWYGLPNYSFFDTSVVNNIDEKQQYNTFAIGGKLSLKDSFFKQASLQFKHFSDDFGSAENRFFIKPNFDFKVI